VIISREGTRSSNRILILPDTAGEIDFRPPFQIIPLIDSEREPLYMVLTSDEQKSLTGSVKEYSRVSGLIILSYKRDMMLYDNILKQSLLLPPEIDLVHAARGEIEGTYFLWDGSGVFLWDRYGREPTKKTTSLEYQGYTFSWGEGATSIADKTGAQTVSGLWFPLFSREKLLITDGNEVRELLPRK